MNVTGNAIANGAIRGVASSVITQGVSVAVGLQDHFSWQQVAASAAAGGVGAAVGGMASSALADSGLSAGTQRIVAGAAAGIAAGTTAAVMRGGRVQIAQIAADAFGNALGSSLEGANLSQPAWDGTSYHYLDKTPVEGIFLGTAGGANTAAYTSPDPILLASNNMSDAYLSPNEEAIIRAFGGNPAQAHRDDAGIVNFDAAATTAVAKRLSAPGLLDSETYTPGTYDYTDGSRKLLSGQFVELGTPGNPGVIRNLSGWEAFTSMSTPGQMLRGALNRLDSIGDMAVQAVVHPTAPILNGIERYVGAYQQGHLGDTILNDIGGTVQGLVKSTPVGLADALYKKDAAGGMERLGGALFDNAVAAGGVAAGRLAAENAAGGWSVRPYSGDVYSSDFVGPVQWKSFYRGDASARTDFLSSMAQERGIQATTEFLDSHAAGGFNDIYAAHGIGSQGLPTIGVTDNQAVAEYFARGPAQNQNGVVTTFRLEARDAERFAIPNYENPQAFFEPNPHIGLPEREYLFHTQIDPKYIFQQVPVGPK
ncbi:hypothetical protein [Ralstonia syzygii]|uniref:hypothetical protein n=1 Tax=Ralstonia syzygii TaxID=28097 RepID=UPI0018D07803|nr:hypothetical protein [Ralstonia syzygii]